MFVGNRKSQFSRLTLKKIGVELGTAAQGYFEGIGVITASIPGNTNQVLLLYPAYFSPTDKYPTISTGALRSSTKFNQVIHYANKQLALVSRTTSFNLPCTVIDGIDFIHLNIHTIHNSHPTKKKVRFNLPNRQNLYGFSSLQPISITNKTLPGTTLFSALLHQYYGHRSLSILQDMVDKGYIKGPGLPCKLAPLPGRCPICDAARMTKVPRVKLKDHSSLPIGTRFHLDWAFWNVASIRGFTATLIVIEATTRYVWVFNSRSKSAPIDICLYFFNQLKSQGYPCIRLRCDEDGGLVNSTEFCKIMYKDLGMTLESTGGYESTINGTAETPIRTLKRTVRSSLIASGISNLFHCFASGHAATIYNNVIHRTTGKVPAIEMNGSAIPIHKMYPFGSKVKVLTDLKSKRSLTARTSGDQRHENDYDVDTASASEIPKSSFTGIFLGYSNFHNVMLVYKEGTDQTTHRVQRVHHAYVDPYGLSASSQDSFSPNEIMLRQMHNDTFDKNAMTKWQAQLPPCDFDSITSPFDPSICESFLITLPPRGISIGIYIDTDEDYLVPILAKISKDRDLYDQIPLKHHFYNSWIIQIEDEHPITAQGMIDALYYLQREGEQRQVLITLCPMDEPVRYYHQTYRHYFDSCTHLKNHHMVTLPYEPKAHPSIFKCLDSDLRTEWKSALAHQYHKNDDVRLVAQPTPKENVPEGRKILPAVMSTKIKKKGENIYQFVARMCANGSKQQQGIDYEFSYSPTAGMAPIRITLSTAAALDFVLAVIDVVNCFQSTLVPPEKRLIISMPPFYRTWFEDKYPEVKWEHSPSNKYVLEVLNGIQGDKSIGRRWYLLLKRLLEDFGFACCISEPSLFIYDKNGETMILNTSTDDFLCAYNHKSIFDKLCAKMRTMFDITTKEGTKFKYLNLEIIQTEHGVSYDQTDHIQRKIINKYFPPDKINDSKLKQVHTPFRTDSDYEKDLAEQLPATKDELKILEERYGDSYGAILGELMHVEVISRFDLSYSMRRLAQFTHAPSEAAFAGLYRVLRFLATHVHRPVMYPRRSFDGFEEINVEFDDPHSRSISIPRTPCTIVDSDHARDTLRRKSHHCVVSLLNGVIVHNRVQQQRAVALHSTHSEIIGSLAATKETIYLQDIYTHIGHPPSNIFPFPLYIDSKPCIDSLEANTVTTRVKHIAVPIKFIHEKITLDRIKLNWIDTTLNLADSGTKPNPSPTHFRHYDYLIGVRFYPPKGSEHYTLLHLDDFKNSPYTKQSKQQKSTTVNTPDEKQHGSNLSSAPADNDQPKSH